MSDELESIGISIVLDDGIAEGMRRISRDMSLFSRQTDQTAAQMSRIARLHLGTYIPPEPVRQSPPATAAVIAPMPQKAPSVPAIEAPQAPRLSMPKLAPEPAPSVSVQIKREQTPSPAMSAVPSPPPVQPPVSVQQPALPPAPPVQPAAPMERRATAGQQVPPQPSPAPFVRPAPVGPVPSGQQVSPQPRPLSEVQEVSPQARSVLAVPPVPPPPDLPPVAVSSPLARITAVVPPLTPGTKPPADSQLKLAAKPSIKVALSNPSSPVQPLARLVPVRAAAPETPLLRTKSAPSPSAESPPTAGSSSARKTPVSSAQARETTRPRSTTTPPMAKTASTAVVYQRPPKVGPAMPSAAPSRSAGPAPAVASTREPITEAGKATVPDRVTPPPRLPTAPDGVRNVVSHVPSSAPPASASLNPQPPSATTATAATTQAPAPSTHAQMANVQGDVMLDGAQVGRWLSGAMAREAGRPPTAARSFNTRMAPAWPGTPL